MRQYITFYKRVTKGASAIVLRLRTLYTYRNRFQSNIL